MFVTVFALLMLYSLLKALRASRSLLVYRLINQMITAFLMAVFVNAYKANLRAILSDGLMGEKPFKNVDQLSAKIATDDGKLMLFSFVNSIYEMINDCRNADTGYRISSK